MIIHVEIDDIDLLDEYGLYLIDRDIGVATPNLYQTTIPGRNGKLDYTDFYGEVTYQNRQIKITLAKKVDKKTQDLKYELEKTYNGQLVKLSFSDDEDHYWKGRITVTSNDDDTELYKVEFNMDAHPYKFLKLYDKEVR